MILSEATRCRSIMRGLLDFARQSRVVKAPTDLGAVMRAVAADFGLKVQGTGMAVRAEAADDLPEAMLDAEQIRQMLVNLVQNGLDACAGRGEVTMSAGLGADGRSVVIRVRDTGCGMPPEVQSQIFTPFYTTKQLGQGHGHGHEHRLRRGEDARRRHLGGEFAGLGHHVPHPAAAGAGERPGRGRHRMTKSILLVDDDPDFLEQNRMLLEANGYAVRTAASGRECLAAVEAGRPDLIILDMVMGERQEGFDVSRELRNSEYTKGIPLVMITSVNDAIPFRIEPDRTWLPVDALIEKPVDPQLLLGVVQRVCGGTRAAERSAAVRRECDLMAHSILLVDDDRDFLEMNRGVLEARGYRVRCAADPQAALAAAESERPDLVVTDLMMDRLDAGFSLARSMKERFADVPVILVTAVSVQRGFDFRPRGAVDLAAMHADAYFDKPVDPAALTARVEELLA